MTIKALTKLRKELAKSDGPFIARNLTNWYDLSEPEILAVLVELCEETPMIECEGCGTLCDVPGNDEDESRETRRYNRSCTCCSRALGTGTVRVFRGRKCH